MSDTPCRKCGSPCFKTKNIIFKNGTEHIEKRCLECNAFINYMAKEIPPGMFVMPYGKYQGKPLQWIVDNDRDYAHWILEKEDGRALGNRVCILLG